jgi:hypothetical protein
MTWALSKDTIPKRAQKIGPISGFLCFANIKERLIDFDSGRETKFTQMAQNSPEYHDIFSNNDV